MTKTHGEQHGAVCVTALLANFAFAVGATTQLEFTGSSDLTATPSGVVIDDAIVASDDFGAPPSVTTLPGVPANADVTALAREGDGTLLVAFDITLALPGSSALLTVTPRDVARLSDGLYSLAFDGVAYGVPAGARVDAVSIHPAGLLFSFDVTAVLGEVIAADADLVLWNGAAYSLFFDASAASVPAGVDLDGVHYIAVRDRFQASFDVTARLGMDTADDEDVVEFDPIGTSVILALDADALHAGWGAVDLDALHAVTDADDDGLGDEAEIAIGTAPLDPDSDDDGLLDGVETDTKVFVGADDTGTDPLDEDSDDDGISDGDEVAGGSDPNNPNDPAVQQIPATPASGALALALLLWGVAVLSTTPYAGSWSHGEKAL